MNLRDPMLAVRSDWPDSLDAAVLVCFLALVLAVPLTGYWFMFLDIRASARALRRILVRLTNNLPDLPPWARSETPACLRVLGLRTPCSEEQVKRAYRRLAEGLHPDRGGDRQRFLMLQRHFEAAVCLVREQTVGARAAPAGSESPLKSEGQPL
jgi:hypothetical protein